jgi:hypothetical protein
VFILEFSTLHPWSILASFGLACHFAFGQILGTKTPVGCGLVPDQWSSFIDQGQCQRQSLAPVLQQERRTILAAVATGNGVDALATVGLASRVRCGRFWFSNTMELKVVENLIG